MLTSGLFGYPADYLLWCLIYVSLLVHTWCFFKFFPRRKRRKPGLVIGNALVFVCMIGFVALAVETHLRFYSVKMDAFGTTLPAQRWFFLYADLNSLQCRDQEWTIDKPEGVRRIAFVGDSFIYGWGIKRVEDRFTDRLQTRFNQRTPDTVEVMNVARPGWDTGEQIQPIQDMIEAYGVDEVVLCYTANDIEKLLPTSDDFDPTVPPQPTLFNTDSSCVLDYIYRRVYTPFVASVRNYHDWLADGYADPDLWQSQQERLGTIIQTCQENDVVLRAVLLPFIRTGGERYDAQAIHLLLRRFFELNDVPVVDLLPVVAGLSPDDLVVNRHDPHPNERANALFAERIWQAFYAP